MQKMCEAEDIYILNNAWKINYVNNYYIKIIIIFTSHNYFLNDQ